MVYPLIAKMHAERKQASSEFLRRFAIHREVLGLTNEQVDQLYPALLGRRSIWSLTADELLAFVARVEAFRSRAELQEFLDAQQDTRPDLRVASEGGFAWSANAPHIQSLFAPWQLGDGYSEAVIRRGETALGQRFPEPLRSFYRSWGTRKDLVYLHNHLLGPHAILVRSQTLIIGVENQGVVYWGVRWVDLAQENPPVYWAYNQETALEWTLSQPHLSDFLDTLMYTHAFGGGALHGGLPRRVSDPTLLDRHWRRIEVPTVPMDWAPDAVEMSPWPIYVRDGQAIERGVLGGVAARTPEDLEEIAQILDTTWAKRW